MKSQFQFISVREFKNFLSSASEIRFFIGYLTGITDYYILLMYDAAPMGT